MRKYYSIGIDRDGTLEGATREVMKGLHGKLHNEHKERGQSEFWRCQRQLAVAVLARIEIEQVRLANDDAAWHEDQNERATCEDKTCSICGAEGDENCLNVPHVTSRRPPNRPGFDGKMVGPWDKQQHSHGGQCG